MICWSSLFSIKNLSCVYFVKITKIALSQKRREWLSSPLAVLKYFRVLLFSKLSALDLFLLVRYDLKHDFEWKSLKSYVKSQNHVLNSISRTKKDLELILYRKVVLKTTSKLPTESSTTLRVCEIKQFSWFSPKFLTGAPLRIFKKILKVHKKIWPLTFRKTFSQVVFGTQRTFCKSFIKTFDT